MWSSLHIHFSNDYFPSRDRYDSLRWEEDERYIMNALPDSLTDRHSIIRQDYRASVNVGIDDATILLDTKTGELAFPEPVDDYQMYKGKLYIAANNKVIVCNSKGGLIKEFKQKDWDSSLLWE